MQSIANAVTNNVEDEEESKAERDLESDINMDMHTTAEQRNERLLDAIYYDDDMVETKLMIWVQCRRCQWSCLVEFYFVGECQCTWGRVEGLEEYMQALNLENNVLGEDFTEWSDHESPQELHSVHGDSTEDEMTKTSSDDMPSLVDVADDRSRCI
jgi:hypothetical protein